MCTHRKLREHITWWPDLSPRNGKLPEPRREGGTVGSRRGRTLQAEGELHEQIRRCLRRLRVHEGWQSIRCPAHGSERAGVRIRIGMSARKASGHERFRLFLRGWGATEGLWAREPHGPV